MSQNEDGKFDDVELPELRQLLQLAQMAKQMSELQFQLSLAHALLFALVEGTEAKRLLVPKSLQEKLANRVHPSQWHVQMEENAGDIIIRQQTPAADAPPPVGSPGSSLAKTTVH